MQEIATKRGFTGWHMLWIMVAFFGTIITVNVTMAFYANSSWSGMLSKNTYVASQDFNIKAAQAREWARQGFRGKITVDRSAISYFLEGPVEAVSEVTTVTAAFNRPVGDDQDFAIDLEPAAGGTFSAAHELAPGPWIVDVEAKSHDRTVFHQAERIVIEERSK
jgi:nitrogen fixation protein FixH